MEIYWLGHGCFRLKGRDATIVTDPAPPTTGYRISRLAADIVTISKEQAESSYRQALTGEPIYISGPGEYEIGGVLMTGVRTNHEPSSGAPRNIAYVFELDDVRVCHLGSITRRPAADEAEALSEIDVLLIPVGGGGALDAEAAAETVSLLDPKIVIPMRYKTEAAVGELEPVDKFLKEMGVEAKAPETRLNLTKSTVPTDTTVVLLNYRG